MENETEGDTAECSAETIDSPAAVDIPTDAALWVRDLAHQANRSNKCPRCGGEFDEWRENWAGEEYCPFCGLRATEYDPEGDGE